MQTFIEVAMDTTAGEGDEIQDRLSDLSDLCGKFSPIIFKLEAVKSSQALLKLFKDTWDLIKSLRDPISTVVSYLIIIQCEHITLNIPLFTDRIYVMEICNGISKLVNFKDLWKEGQKSN